MSAETPGFQSTAASSAAGTLAAQTLLAHQEFVLALARSLLRDEDAARDVVQETWLAALARPPRSPHVAGSLRSWLARVARSRAGDHVRREGRRVQQETLAAREEADHSEAELRERVALRQTVVEAVLALREPYRTTVLLHYEEGLSAQEIARRKGVPAGTVRAQISRAHELLRERLDGEFGGSRRAWALALGALVERARPAVSAAKLAAAAAVVAGAGTAVVVWGNLPRGPALASGDAEVARRAEMPATSPAVESSADLDAGANEGARSLAAIGDAVAISEPELGSHGAHGARSNAVANGGFEAELSAGALAGWRVIIGATNGAEEPLSVLRLDAEAKHGGRSSLFVSGDDATRAWRTVMQDVPARPGATYRVSAWAKAEDVRQESVRGTEVRQYANCFVGVFLSDGSGELVARALRTPALPSSGWQRLSFEVAAPDSTRAAIVSISKTMSGSLWVDDVELEIVGGREAPAPEVLAREDFEDATGLPAGWEAFPAAPGEVGAPADAAVDRASGANGSRASLRLSGDARTAIPRGVARRCAVSAGDTIQLRAQLRATTRTNGAGDGALRVEDARVRLSFLDAAGTIVGAPKSAKRPPDGGEWAPVSVASVAPVGSASVLAELSLSGPGPAWFDDVCVTRDGGARPPYDDWKTLETEHVTLRFPPDVGSVEDRGRALDRAYEEAVRRLEVDFAERVTVYLYRDAEQGERLTGRALGFSIPEERAVHQRMENTPGHEIAHCVALAIGRTPTPLFEEGIAVWLDGTPPAEHHARAARLRAGGELPELRALLEDFRAQKGGYVAASSLCGFVVERYGIAAFKRLYLAADPAAEAPLALGGSLDAVDAEWRRALEDRP